MPCMSLKNKLQSQSVASPLLGENETLRALLENSLWERHLLCTSWPVSSDGLATQEPTGFPVICYNKVVVKSI